ncbi:hypothetical protein NS2_54360 [Nocardia seriolae NBRC 15557]|nr:hypothetical protein NSER024013_55220 [Nocardia seriolae]GEM27197.1 hypothetical protein NS2_54360 [Nocardia seriolae NBRC 15557]
MMTISPMPTPTQINPPATVDLLPLLAAALTASYSRKATPGKIRLATPLPGLTNGVSPEQGTG